MNGKAIYAAQAVFADKHIVVRLIGFDPTSGAVRLAVDEIHESVGSFRITATFGSGNSAYTDYDGGNPNRDNRPILQTPKQYDTLKEIRVGPVPPPLKAVPVFRPEKACEQYKQLERQWKSAREEWMYFVSPSTKDIRGTSARKSKQMARDAQEKMREARQRMDWHEQSCGACKAAMKDSTNG
jgi:hypothetical protein